MRRFPPLRPEVLALLAATMASPAWAGDPASAAKGAAQTEPAKPGAPQRFLGDKSSIAIQGGDLVIHDSSTLTMLRLHPIAAAVFLLADGQKPLAAIRSEAETSTGLPVDEATLFAVLDALADAKLLSARVTPPGSGDLSSFVLSDGTLGSALVEAGAAQPEAKLKLPEAKAKESANMAREDLKKVQERLRDREAKAKVVREAPGAQASDEAMIPVLKQRAEVLAKSESVLRKRSEQEVKQRYQTERLAGEDEATARKRQGATEAEYKVVRPLTKQ
jgi:hypothetical protein